MKTPCKYPGCSTLLDKSGWCERHQASAPNPRANYDRWRKRDPNQSAVDRFRSSAAWQKARRQKMAVNPLCEDPFGDHARRGDTVSVHGVHHIKGLATHPDLGLSWENLMSVCAKCHARLESEAKKK